MTNNDQSPGTPDASIRAPDRAAFETRMQQRAMLLWLTGLSGSGKSTLGDALAADLHARGYWVARLDGDALRAGLCSDLGFSVQDREENLRRFAQVAQLMLGQGLIVIVSTISPLARHREVVRSIVDAQDLVHLHVDTPLERCEARDPKGLYRRARSGEIPNFTGVSAPYERPADADLQVPTDGTLQASLDTVWSYLNDTGRIVFRA